MNLSLATYESLAQTIKSSRVLSAIVKPLANWQANAAGYRRLGLRYDDIIMEENPVVQEALRRLPAEVLAERTFRHKRAMQLSLCHAELPKEQWTKPSEDVAYLSPFITMVEKEFAEKDKYDNLVVKQ